MVNGTMSSVHALVSSCKVYLLTPPNGQKLILRFSVLGLNLRPLSPVKSPQRANDPTEDGKAQQPKSVWWNPWIIGVHVYSVFLSWLYGGIFGWIMAQTPKAPD